MILKILWFFIILFLIMVVVTLVRSKVGTKAKKVKVVRETSRLTAGLEGKIEKYENEEDHGGVSWEDYLYACYLAGRKVQGIDLKKAVAFQTTCDTRNVHNEDGMKNLLRYSEIYGGIGDTDVNRIYSIGRQISEMIEANK